MPFTKNQIITLEIEALSNDGNGVAHKDGQAVFVPLTAPGGGAHCQADENLCLWPRGEAVDRRAWPHQAGLPGGRPLRRLRAAAYQL